MLRSTIATRAGDARPAPVDPTIAAGTKTSRSGAAAMPADPADAVRRAPRTSRRDWSTAVRPKIAPTQYATDAAEEMYPAPAALRDSESWMSGRNNPYARRTNP